MEINVRIDAKHAHLLIDLMLEHEIPFTATSQQIEVISKITPAAITADVAYLEKKDSFDAIYKKYSETHISQSKEITQLAQEANLSVRKFSQTLKSKHGKTFMQWDMERRMKYAAKLLKQGYKCKSEGIFDKNTTLQRIKSQ